MKNYDEVAKEICVKHFGYVVQEPDELTKELQRIISDALRSAYQDGVEASAKVAEDMQFKVPHYEDMISEIRKLVL